MRRFADAPMNMTRRPSADGKTPPAKLGAADTFATDPSIEPTQAAGAGPGGTSDDLSGQSLGAYEIIGKLGQMEHPHLVQAHDAGEDRGIHYLALELVEGGDLESKQPAVAGASELGT